MALISNANPNIRKHSTFQQLSIEQGKKYPASRRWPCASTMVLIESNVRGNERSLRKFDWSPQPTKPQSLPVKVSVVVSGDEGPYALSAADLATVESEKTRDKIKIKADHVSTNLGWHCTVGMALAHLFCKRR